MKSLYCRSMCLKVIVLILVVSYCFSSSAFSEVIFQDNFDSQADWQPGPGVDDESPGGAGAECSSGDCSASVPTGWSYYRSDGWWWVPSYQDTIRVNSDNHMGASGKAYTQWNESNMGASGDGWGADGVLSKYFTTDYQELYIQFWMKLKTPFIWRKDTIFEAGREDALKIFRVGHYDGTGSVFKFFTNGYTAPLYLFDLKNSHSWGWRQMHSYRCDPQSSNYYCSDSSDDPYFGDSGTEPDDSGQPADGQWHRYTIRIKMNTNTSGTWNSDGVMQFWYDGVLLHSVINKRWIVSGEDTTIGWNIVGIGGNAYNSYSDASNYAEQWYAIDDFLVSTTPIVGEDILLPPVNTRINSNM